MKRQFLIGGLLILVIGFYHSLPDPLFDLPRATLLLDNEEQLLSARIASDEQWRFPTIDTVPSMIEKCILLFEDEYFYYHPGVNPVSILRAIWSNWRAGEVIRGGSTLSMQVIRLSRNNPPRSYLEKIREMVLAMRLELSYSKKEVLNLYASHAPYGGNVVGLETASWRYFNRPPDNLSWSESALLAVLPNAPSLLHPGRNRELLKAKRDRLLRKLYSRSVIDSMTYGLAILEPIPDQPKPLPNHAYHLLSKIESEGMTGQRVVTTLDRHIQKSVQSMVDRHVSHLSQNEIHNGCALIVSLKDQNILAYVGNASLPTTRAPYVDLIHANRSSGSILKPLLYAKAIDQGMIHSTSLLRDVPITIDQYSPSNFDGEFEGVVPADEALYRSLNVPATLLLRDYGIVPFYNDLQKMGFKSIDRPAENYGLSLILGGAEVTLWDIAKCYADLAQKLNDAANRRNLGFIQDRNGDIDSEHHTDIGTWWLITEALTEAERPGINLNWHTISGPAKIAWKTGTSHGFRDAWSVGYNSDYLVAVWVGNADGEGRPGLTGVSSAAPLMFDIFQLLPRDDWFVQPDFYLKDQMLCAKSGYLAGIHCPKQACKVPEIANFTAQCRYHENILVNQEGQQVFIECADGPYEDTTIFKLDPVAGYYYQAKHKSDYFPIKLAGTCTREVDHTLGIIYPANNTKLIIPKNFSGQQERVVLKAHHADENRSLFWHLDNTFLGTTTDPHEIAALLSPGIHRLLIMDENGNQDACNFQAFVDQTGSD